MVTRYKYCGAYLSGTIIYYNNKSIVLISGHTMYITPTIDNNVANTLAPTPSPTLLNGDILSTWIECDNLQFKINNNPIGISNHAIIYL